MKGAVEVAIEAALASGKIQQERSQKIGKISQKGGHDLVTEVDYLCEREIIRIIKSRFPDHEFLAEETGVSKGAPSSSKWVIDPLDGTINYAHGFPFYCTSIALEQDGEVIVGVVYAPCMDELFVAEKGKGSTLNSDPICVSNISRLKDSMLVTGFTPEVVHSADDNIQHFRNFMKASQAVRRPGSAAIDICYTAMGRFEGFWEYKLNAWDVAAGSLIMTEAGGKVTKFDGGPWSIYDRQILASNGLVHQEMVKTLSCG